MTTTPQVQAKLAIAVALGKITASEQKFLTGLGVTGDELTALSDETKTIQQVIEAHSPEDLLNALDESSPGASTSRLTNILRSEPTVAKSFHNAVSKNPTMLKDLQEIDNGSGNSVLDIDSIIDHLEENPGQRNIALRLVKNQLDKMADDPTITLASMQDMFNNAGGTVGLEAMKTFFLDIVNGCGADHALNNLADTMGITGERREALMRVMGPITNLLDGAMGGTNAPGGYWHTHGDTITGGISNFANDLGTLMGGPDNDNFQRTVDGKISTNISRADFKSAFTDAMQGKNITDLDAIREAVVKADPKMKDEIGYIRSDVNLGNSFNNAASLDRLAEKVAELRDGIKDIRADNDSLSGQQVVQRAVGALTP